MKTYFLQKQLEKKADRDNWQVYPDQGKPVKAPVNPKQIEPEYTHSFWKVLGNTAKENVGNAYRWATTPIRWFNDNKQYIHGTIKDTVSDIGEVGKGVVNAWNNGLNGRGWNPYAGIAGDVDKGTYDRTSDAFMVPIMGGSRLAGNLAGGLAEGVDLFTDNHDTASTVKNGIGYLHGKLQDALYADPESKYRNANIERGVAEGYLAALQGKIPKASLPLGYLYGAGAPQRYSSTINQFGVPDEQYDTTRGETNNTVGALKYLPMLFGGGGSWLPAALTGDLLGNATANFNNAGEIDNKVLPDLTENYDSPINRHQQRLEDGLAWLKDGPIGPEEEKEIARYEQAIADIEAERERAVRAAEKDRRDSISSGVTDLAWSAFPALFKIPGVAKRLPAVSWGLWGLEPAAVATYGWAEGEKARMQQELDALRRSKGQEAQ